MHTSYAAVEGQSPCFTTNPKLMTDKLNDHQSESDRFRERYLRKRDTSDYNRRLSEIGIEPEFIHKIELMRLSTQRAPCCRRDVVNNILEQFFEDNENLVKENSIFSRP